MRGKAERYVPRAYGLAAVARILLPGLTRRVLTGGLGCDPDDEHRGRSRGSTARRLSRLR